MQPTTTEEHLADKSLDIITELVAAMTGPFTDQCLPIAVDPQDMKQVFGAAGGAVYGSGEAQGEGRATKAAELAIADIKRRIAEQRGR